MDGLLATTGVRMVPSHEVTLQFLEGTLGNIHEGNLQNEDLHLQKKINENFLGAI